MKLASLVLVASTFAAGAALAQATTTTPAPAPAPAPAPVPAPMDPVVTNLTNQGYTNVQVQQGAGTYTVTASRNGAVRTIVYDAATGQIISDSAANRTGGAGGFFNPNGMGDDNGMDNDNGMDDNGSDDNGSSHHSSSHDHGNDHNGGNDNDD